MDKVLKGDFYCFPNIGRLINFIRDEFKRKIQKTFKCLTGAICLQTVFFRARRGKFESEAVQSSISSPAVILSRLVRRGVESLIVL